MTGSAAIVEDVGGAEGTGESDEEAREMGE